MLAEISGPTTEETTKEKKNIVISTLLNQFSALIL